MAESFDLEELVHLEQTCYDAGYTDGFAHGRIHGLIEGRALGREKGFEIWEEIGFYEGFSETWKAIYALQKREDERANYHITYLLDLIRQFPTTNPSSSSSSQPDAQTESETHPPDDELDLAKLQRQIRSRYKALCASLGVRPTLRAGTGTGPDDQHRGTSTQDPEHHIREQTVQVQRHKRTTRPDVWTLTQTLDRAEVGRPTTVQGLSF